ncbi:MAG TPA: hypothetical protein VL172_21995 [Kofleriaceae bacterium]|nr:hypothetical protein [Kofleriaceae bacterium]
MPWFATPAAAVVVYLLVANLVRGHGGGTRVETVPAAPLADADMDRVAALVAGWWKGEEPPPGAAPARLAEPAWGIYAAARAGGKLRGEVWRDGGTVGSSLMSAVRGLRNRVPDGEVASIDAIELCLTHSYRDAEVRTTDHPIGDVHRGVRGIELRRGNDHLRLGPTEMIARDLDFGDTVGRFLADQGIGEEEVAAGTIDAQTFECEQVLVQLGAPPRATLMFRGNRVVELADVTADALARTETLLSDWMLHNELADGRMTYLYAPSTGSEKPGNNMIRQWMASLALVRIGQRRGDPSVFEAAARNIRWNLSQWYREKDGLGLIVFEGEAKLGAIALAAMSIIEHPERPSFAATEKALVAATFAAQEDSGRFRTYLQGGDQDQQHNYYPGETLLLWSGLYREHPDAQLLERFMRSMRYYRTWHRDHRNPAFIPWHTQAYWRMWQLTRDDELRAWIFEMNDWLCDYQEWDESPYPDLRGRFYDADRPGYGPPHASSTGVYLEGLIAAYQLARTVGDDGRALRYRTAIVRGLRSLLQLTFADDVDLYYVADRDRVRGGVRTTEYENEIRVDNVQHNLLGIMEIGRVFQPADYQLP